MGRKLAETSGWIKDVGVSHIDHIDDARFSPVDKMVDQVFQLKVRQVKQSSVFLKAVRIVNIWKALMPKK